MPFSALDRVRVRAEHEHVAYWEGLIGGQTSPPDWSPNGRPPSGPRGGWYEFVPLDPESAPQMWPGETFIRFHESELELVAKWRAYPISAPYTPQFQAWLWWMNDRANAGADPLLPNPHPAAPAAGDEGRG